MAECVDAVRWALELGYRHIDTAQAYGNEESVGQGLRESGVPREEVFITTKFFPARKDPVAEVERSLQRLGVDYVDLYIIHWPEGGPTWAWPGMERAREAGYARSIGVSNFGVDDLRQLLAAATVPPVVDQVQFSPYEYRKALLDSCRQNGIALEAYSPLGTGRHLSSDTVARIARRHGRTPAQVLLRWCIERGIPVIPKSTHRERIAENAQLFDFALSERGRRRARRARPHRRHRPRSRTQVVAKLTAQSSLRAAIDEVASRDPVLADLVARVGPIRHRPRDPDGPFAALVRAIVFQQLAGRAAQAIYGRVRATVGDTLTPEALNAVSDAELRAAGLSANKLASLRDLSAKVLDGTVVLSRTSRRRDEELIERLTTVRGIGRWTAEMYLMFQLRRLDVWPVDDLGVRQGYALAWNIDPPPTPKQLEPLGDRFRPYRSIVARYCWAAVPLLRPGGTAASLR